MDYASQVQMLAPEPTRAAERDVGRAAAHGISGSGGALPHHETIQRSFGGYDISRVTAHLDRHASEGAAAMGAEAYATGDHVAFGANGASLHTAAHEAAHVVQQRAGVSLAGGVGQAGDRYERHADAVADAVVRGESAEALLGEMAGGGGQRGGSQAVQRRETDAESDPGLSDMSENASGDLALGAPAPLAPESLDRARHEAWMALAGLDQVMTERAFAHYAWLQNNLMKYASATGGATLPVGVGSDLVVKAAGAATTAVVAPSLGKLAVKALAPKYPNYLFKVYKLTAWAAGPLTTLLSFAWNIIDREFAKDRSHELSDAAGQRMATAMSAAVDVARGGMASVLADWRVMSDGLKADLIAVEEAEVFAAITTTLNAQAESIHLGSCDLEKDLSLYADLIAKWLMQTARDGESGGQGHGPRHVREDPRRRIEQELGAVERGGCGRRKG